MSTGGSKYSFIYDKLVEDADDILGIIAYSLYKQQKIEFIRDFKNERGVDPTEDDLAAFRRISNSDSSIEGYKTRALVLAQKFLDEALGERVEQIEADKNLQLAEQVKSIKPLSFWQGVLQSLMVSIVVSVITGIIIFASLSVRFGFAGAIGTFFDVKITDQPKTTAPERSQVAP